MEILPEPLYVANDLVAIYELFKREVVNPKSVLYPSCGFDASPAKVFDNVTFVDVEDGNTGCTNMLRSVGLTAITGDIRAYAPKELHDVLILLNPAIPTAWATQHISLGGFVIANDYHGSATELYDRKDEFDLFGTIALDWKSYVATLSRNLEDLFVPVIDEFELQKYRPDSYDFILKMMATFARNRGEVETRPFSEQWADYRKRMDEGMPSRRVADRYIFQKK